MRNKLDNCPSSSSSRVRMRVIKALIRRAFIALSGGRKIGFLDVVLEPLVHGGVHILVRAEWKP